MLDVRRLRLLREVKVRGTISAAAEALHQTPSSVSQQLAVLEREAGTQLLRKVGRRLQFTAAGELLVEHAAVVLAQLETASSDLSDLSDDVSGLVRIAVFQSAALALMPSSLSQLTHRYPRLRVTVTQREPESALRETWASDFDLVVAEQYPNHAAPWHRGLDRVDLVSDEIRLAVPPGEEWTGIAEIAGAASVPWVMEPYGVASRHFAEQMCRRAGFEPDVRYETADLQAQIALIESGNAVALIPDLMWARRTPSVRLVGLEGSPRRTVFTAARRASASSPAVAACREALGDAAREAGIGEVLQGT